MDEAATRPAIRGPASASASTSTTAQTARPGAPQNAPRVQQPKPQALPSRSGPSTILVSPRQKGNPILNSVKTVAWEYSDIPADYVLGATTCALFLSLKYHRLHPEYIYNRIRDLKGQYQLRVLLTMVDIENHEDSLRELSKTSLVNNVTIMLAWSAQEAGRYLELFKTFEHAAPTSIKAQQSSSYSDKLVEFITVPRSINKTDALGLVSNFGSVRTAINASPEEVGLIAGWGEKKVQRWCNSVREPFRIKQAAKRGITRENTLATSQKSLSRGVSILEGDDAILDDTLETSVHRRVDDAVPLAAELSRTAPVTAASDADKRPSHRIAEDGSDPRSNAAQRAVQKESEAAIPANTKKRKQDDENMSDGIMAALNKLRQHFSKLPAELQIEVFGYLENTDLKAVRSVSTSCRDNASPHLFRSIIACARYQAMGAFQNVALHPVYQKYVKEVVFDATVYDERIAKNERLYLSSTLGEVSWVRHSRWKRYQSLYREQEEIKEGVLLQTIARALEWMPHVETITYCSHPLHVPVEKKLMKDILGRSALYPALDVPSRTNSYGSIEVNENAFHHLIGAICIAKYSSIREFRVKQAQHNTPSRWLALREFHFAEPSHLESGKFFFRNLRKIELDLDFRFAAGGHECLANLRALLSEAKDLLHLRLYVEPRHHLHGIRAWLSDPVIQSPFRCLGLATEWPELRSIDLGRIVATEDELRDLLHRGKGTITSMKLTNCIITTGKWSNLVDEVVYGTKIRIFVLDRVHEQFVGGGVAFETLTPEEKDKCTYKGQIKENEQGARYFWERPGKSVYAWRDLPSDEVGSSVAD
ncbi:hypothetical protein P171DRAFT_355049 [Karstenula rhodostoma CBS 690.94]|uniref:ERCC1-like central domain-containing protein n=1 Tax=Karstenula rhodostoma CBS 690.94 TaxID=1392251 RepID=A0A9P4UDL4_9PLEO|nr:hypothetical protein P171DRAFT_355049 [Karstenula rhodostoma CBS 690.94]